MRLHNICPLLDCVLHHLSFHWSRFHWKFVQIFGNFWECGKVEKLILCIFSEINSLLLRNACHFSRLRTTISGSSKTWDFESLRDCTERFLLHLCLQLYTVMSHKAAPLPPGITSVSPLAFITCFHMSYAVPIVHRSVPRFIFSYVDISNQSFLNGGVVWTIEVR